MITAHEAAIVAAYDGDGGFVHLHCWENHNQDIVAAVEEYQEENKVHTGYGWRFPDFYEAAEQLGIELPEFYSRYSIDECAGYELENDVQYLVGLSDEDLVDRFTERGTMDSADPPIALMEALEHRQNDIHGPLSDWLYDHADEWGYGVVRCEDCGDPIE